VGASRGSNGYARRGRARGRPAGIDSLRSFSQRLELTQVHRASAALRFRRAHFVIDFTPAGPADSSWTETCKRSGLARAGVIE
jgi:hypothetical protein